MLEIFIIIAIYLIAFVILWYATGLIFDGTRQLTQLTKLSSFATSFFILGMLTSIPELSVGLNAVADKQPSIFVGDLLGATLTLFGLVIPLLLSFLLGVGIPVILYYGIFIESFGTLIIVFLTGIFQILVFTSFAFLIATLNEDKLKGLGLSIFIWLFFIKY